MYSGVQVPDGARPPFIVARWGSAVSPAEIVRIDPVTKKQTLLTRFNSEKAAAIDWPPLQEFWFVNAQGRRIHNFVVLPHGFDPAKKYPLFVLIHGGHANMWRDSITLRWNYHLLASPGYVVLMTDYRGSTGYGEEFTLDILGDPLRGPADDINEAADEAIKRFPFIDGIAPGGGRRELRRPSRELARGDDRRATSAWSATRACPTWSRSGRPATRIYHRELMMGGPVWEQGAAWTTRARSRTRRTSRPRCCSRSARTTSACR